MKKYLLPSFLILCISSISAQDLMPYIRKAWAANAELKAKDFQLEQTIFAIKEAKAMYGPAVAFNTQYTLAAGGRTINFPAGDLLNPVYNTLNDLTNSNQFKLLENQNITFLPNNFYDAKLSVQQPIYYPDLALNRRMKSLESDLKLLEIKAYKRYLAREVMVTYFQGESAYQAMAIYTEADKVLAEARRTTQSLLTNGLALPSSIQRIESQMASINASAIETLHQKKNADAYMVFLTGDTLNFNDSSSFPALPAAYMVGTTSREEILQLDIANQMTGLGIEKEDNFYKPKIGAALNAGSQDFNFGLQPYALLAVNFELNLYDHKRHSYRKDQAKAAATSQEWLQEQVKKQIDLQSTIAEHNLASAIAQAKTFMPRISAAERNYKDVFTRYKVGTANYLELLDAQGLLTQTQLQYQVAKSNAWIKWADLMYSKAILSIE